MADQNEAEIPMVPVPDSYRRNHPSKPHLKDIDEYHAMYKESIEDPSSFFGKQARELLSWDKEPENVINGSFEDGDVSFFQQGRLNLSYNCIDRHAFKNPDKIAIHYEADEPGEGRSISYGELLREVSQLAWVLKDMGVKKGDSVCLYIPMVPFAAFAMLACARIGAIHSVVFAGFSSDSLRDRINDAQSKVVLTTDEGRRGGKTIATKKIVDEALKQCPGVTHVLVNKRTGNDVPWTDGRDLWHSEECSKWPRYFAPESMAAEDPLFLLYTSGSTGKPKGLLHTGAGFALGAILTSKYTFDLHSDDTLFCAGDLGWVTGHSYVLYGPLLLGCTTILFESTPVYKDASRYWSVCDKFSVTHFYCAPTALRLLKKLSGDKVNFRGDKLRVLASVGEPIAQEIWNWYYKVVGKEKAHVIDTYWQTETGSHCLNPMAGVTPTKAGSATLPAFGILPVILDPVSGEVVTDNNVEGVLAFKQPWPSQARTIYKDHARYRETYLQPYKGYFFTGDGVSRDDDGYFWIRGRIDDVVNVSGHRISTAEIEAALLEHPSVSECAAVGVSDELTGQALNAFVSLKDGYDNTPELQKSLIQQVRKSIGPFASPKAIFAVDDLPKTRSGKIMRRLLRKILAGEENEIGDTSTLSEPAVVDNIIKVVKEARK